jgi:hypothetical protein
MIGWTILAIVAHIAGALPLAVCGGAWFRKRPVAPAALLLSVGFALSAIADTWGLFLALSGRENLWITYILVPVQMAVFLLALGKLPWERVVVLVYLLVVALSFTVGDFRNHEVVASVQLGALVSLIAFQNDTVRRWREPIVIYCAATIPFLLVMGAASPAANPAWVGAWAGYQGVRIVGLVWMSWLIFRAARPKQLEVA